MREYIKKEWYVYAKKAPFNDLAEKLGVDPVTVRIMRNRDITTEEEMELYLNGTMSELCDAHLLPDILPAAGMIIDSIKTGEKIRIVGDYDVDGVCAAYILTDGLRKIGADADCVIPDRVKDGYGINMSIVEKARDDGIGLILTCDNGISAIYELKAAKECGIKVIVTDHHDIRKNEEGNEVLPPADHIVSAKLSASRYPEKEICGAVTAWKLLKVIYENYNVPLSEWEKYLEFASLATIGDVMRLIGENRIIAKEGLKKMSRGPVNKGLKALIDAAGLSEKEITCFHVGYVLGPCINAGGRLETAEKALRLFMSGNDTEAYDLALSLKELNDNRKYLTQKGADDAIREVEEKYLDDRVLMVYLPGLHESMAGIVAGRLKEKFGKPSFVITDSSTEAADEGGRLRRILKGSGRSIESYNMFEGLLKADSLLYRYGGHPMAAGLSFFEENLELLRKQLNDECGLSEKDLVRRIWIDAPMPMSYVTAGLLQEFKKLEPFGNGNEKPVFAEKGVRTVNMKVLGKNRNVLKMDLISQEGRTYSGIMFGEADALKAELSEKNSVSIIYCPQINEHNGQRTLQIQIEDIR